MEKDVAQLKELLIKKDKEGKRRASVATRQSKSQEGRAAWEKQLRQEDFKLLIQNKELEDKLNNLNFRYMTGGAGWPRPSESGYGSVDVPVNPFTSGLIADRPIISSKKQCRTRLNG